MNSHNPATRKSRSVLLAVAGLAVVGAAAGAWLWSRPPAPPVLHIGDQRGTIRSMLKASGELDHTPYPIQWSNFPVGAPLVEAISDGALDFGYVGASTVTFALGSGAPLRVINVWRFTGTGSGLLVPGDSPIRGLADLRGKRIAVVKGSPGHLLVVEALARAGVPLDQAKIVYLNAGDAKAALSSGAVDAWAIWDPYLAIGQVQDHDRTLVTSAELAPEVECGVASAAAIRDKRAELLDFTGRVRRALDWAEGHREAAAEAYAADTGVPLNLARIVRGRMHVTVEPVVTDQAVAIHQHDADLYARIGLLPHPIAVEQVYDRSFRLPVATSPSS